jgi:hypothetical protein
MILSFALSLDFLSINPLRDPVVSTWGCHQMRGRDESMVVIEWVKSPIVTIFRGTIHKDPLLAIWG